MPSSPPIPWYAIRVKSNRERIAAQALTGKGFQVCVPVYSERRWRQQVPRTVELPLFPGYIFCRLDASNRLPVLTAPGVVHIVGRARIPEPVEEAEIAAVLLVLKSGLAVRPHAELPAGQCVRLIQGPLAGIEGVILTDTNAARLAVSITLLQRSISVEVERQWVMPVHRRAACPAGWAPETTTMPLREHRLWPNDIC